MFATTTLITLAALAAAGVRADPNPLEPGVGQTFNEGSTCHIAWSADTTGTWKTMNIELMTGDNFDMKYLTTVATVDGTSSSNATFDYPCPSVTPNSAIYFYQFSSPASSQLYWTTRFAIADASGKTTPPSNAKQTNGDPIPWGTGALSDPNSAVPQPSSGAGNSSSVTVSGTATSATSALSANGTSSTASASATSSGLSKSATGSGTGAAQATGGSDSGSSSGGSTAASNGAGAIDARVFVSLAGVVAVFAALL